MMELHTPSSIFRRIFVQIWIEFLKIQNKEIFLKKGIIMSVDTINKWSIIEENKRIPNEK